MTIEELEALREEATKRFEELQNELMRLQGEHRVLTKLIEKEQENATDSTEGQL